MNESLLSALSSFFLVIDAELGTGNAFFLLLLVFSAICLLKEKSNKPQKYADAQEDSRHTPRPVIHGDQTRKAELLLRTLPSRLWLL